MKGKSRLVVFAIFVAGVLLVWNWYRPRNVRLSQEPPRQAGTLALAPRDSVLTVRVDVPLAALRATADSALPSSYSFGGNGDDACVDLGLLGKHCAGTHYKGSVQRAGNFTIAAKDDNTVEVSLPLRVEGKGGLRGDGAKLLRLDAKNFRASFVVSAKVSADLGADWCPVVKVTPSFNWTETPRVEIVERVWTVVTGQVEPQLKAKLNDLAQKLTEGIKCDDLRREVQKVWRVHALPISGPPNPVFFANITPKSIGFSGVKVTPEMMRFAVRLVASTEVSPRAAAAAALGDLPAVEHIDDVPGTLSLSVPVRVGYDALQKAILEQVKDRIFTADTPAGVVRVQVKDVFVYPSGERLAVGLQFLAQMPNRLLNTGGRVYLTASPVTEKDGTVIRLADAKFSRILENDLWSVASAVFEKQVKTFIGEQVRYDLTLDIGKLKAELQNRVGDPAAAPGFMIAIRDVRAGVSQIVPEAHMLGALVLVDIGADVSVEKIPVAKVAMSGQTSAP